MGRRDARLSDRPSRRPDHARGFRCSTDRDGDGFFETATVFADDLLFATGVQPWKGGVFVTLAGKVAYMKDTDGDGRADVDETWFTGFAEENTQLRANHPRLALDNHIYVANGLRGGKIVDARQPDAKPVSISGMDFRFDPRTRRVRSRLRRGQFGLTFDDYGNRFVCTNRNPVIHVVLEDRVPEEEPARAPSPPSCTTWRRRAKSRASIPIARAWTTSNLHAGQFTAACGVEIYRGDALPAEYLRQRLRLRADRPPRAPRNHEAGRASRSRRRRPMKDANSSPRATSGVRPVNLEVGPDGALYVVDMYRAVIEHPEWMPDELRKRPDLRDGNDRGRIYRIVPQDFRRPPAPQLVGQLRASRSSNLGAPECLVARNGRPAAARAAGQKHRLQTATKCALASDSSRCPNPCAVVAERVLECSRGLLIRYAVRSRIPRRGTRDYRQRETRFDDVNCLAQHMFASVLDQWRSSSSIPGTSKYLAVAADSSSTQSIRGNWMRC